MVISSWGRVLCVHVNELPRLDVGSLASTTWIQSAARAIGVLVLHGPIGKVCAWWGLGGSWPRRDGRSRRCPPCRCVLGHWPLNVHHLQRSCTLCCTWVSVVVGTTHYWRRSPTGPCSRTICVRNRATATTPRGSITQNHLRHQRTH